MALIEQTEMKAKEKKRTPKQQQPAVHLGYEQAKPAAVLDELKRAKIELLVDTRAVAASRRPGFSKRQLAAALDEEDIGYVHLQKLGTPAEGRQLRATATPTRSGVSTTSTSRSADAQGELRELIALIKSGKRIALLCYCRDPKTCHRSRIVANVKNRMAVESRPT